MNNSPRSRRVNSSFQWYRILVDADGKKTRILRQSHVPGDVPILGNSHEAFRNDYGNKEHRNSYVRRSKWYKKQVPTK